MVGGRRKRRSISDGKVDLGLVEKEENNVYSKALDIFVQGDYYYFSKGTKCSVSLQV